MRSGWLHTQDDHGRLPVEQRQAPFGPEISWPTGYSGLEYRDGDYRYPASRVQQLPVSQGEHPYAAFSAAGYGDDGYRDPGYDGPASQDAGIAGTRTVRGFVVPGQEQPGYALPPVSQPGYGQGGYTSPGYGESSHIELVYPHPSAAEAYPAADTYRQPWDYDQPLRYEGEDASYPARDSYGRPDGHQQSAGYGRPDDYGRSDDYGRDDYGRPDNYAHADGYGSGSYRVPPYDPADYNGSDYSMPGINGPGYDLSGIIGTSDFEAVGYDEPSYGRLSYDDPRYDNEPRYGDSRYDEPHDDSRGGFRFDETRFDVPRFDETRLDNLWVADGEIRHDASVGYGSDGFGADGPVRSDYPGFDHAGSGRFDETRLDLNAADLRMDHTRFDMPAFDETRIDGMRALGSATGPRQVATGLLAPPEDQPMSWADETSLDVFSDLNLDEELAQVPAAFVRTAMSPGEDTARRRKIGRRRGRSGDRRQWAALGFIAIAAAGTIGGVLMKYVFHGPSGPAHTVVAPNQVDAFTRTPELEKQMKVGALREDIMQKSAGQAANVVSAVYEQGGLEPGSSPQIFMFVGGQLSNASPSTSLASFTEQYPEAKIVSAGAMGGEAACTEAQANGQSVAMCVWFDNDSFGDLLSPTMTQAKLATTLNEVRPSLELYAK
jgi:hypothetical protein